MQRVFSTSYKINFPFSAKFGNKPKENEQQSASIESPFCLRCFIKSFEHKFYVTILLSRKICQFFRLNVKQKGPSENDKLVIIDLQRVFSTSHKCYFSFSAKFRNKPKENEQQSASASSKGTVPCDNCGGLQLVTWKGGGYNMTP